MNEPEERTQAVFQILCSLGHTEFVYLLADLYSIRGWAPSITTGDPDTVGDLVANQVLPEPKSLAAYYYDGEGLSKEELGERLDRLHQDQLIVIVSGAPSDGAISLSRRNPVSIIGVGDIAEEIVRSSTLDVLRDHIPEESPLLDEYEALFSQIPKQTEREDGTMDGRSTDDEADQSTDDKSDESVVDDNPRKSGHTSPTDIPTLSENAIGTEGEFYGMEYLGHDFVSGNDDSGTLVGIEVFAKEHDIEIWPEKVSIQIASGYSYQCIKGYDAPLVNPLVSQLSSVWRGDSRVDIPAGGRVKMLLFFNSADPVQIKSIRYSKSYHLLFQMNRKQIEPRTGHNSSSTFSTEIGVSSNSSPNKQTNLPTEVRTLIDSLGYQIRTVE